MATEQVSRGMMMMVSFLLKMNITILGSLLREIFSLLRERSGQNLVEHGFDLDWFLSMGLYFMGGG